MAAKARRAAKPRAAKKTARRVRQRAATRRAARKARVARKPKAPKRAARKGRAPKRKTKGGKKPKKSKRKALKKTARRVRKPKRVTKKSQTGTRRRVWNGSAMYTKGGLTKADLMINPNGKLVSKRSRARAERNSAHIKKWVAALKKAKQELGITGFCVINRGAQGIALYSRAKEIYGN